MFFCEISFICYVACALLFKYMQQCVTELEETCADVMNVYRRAVERYDANISRKDRTIANLRNQLNANNNNQRARNSQHNDAINAVRCENARLQAENQTLYQLVQTVIYTVVFGVVIVQVVLYCLATA
jgi:hypothetical protein